jgi:hypothetical protein
MISIAEFSLVSSRMTEAQYCREHPHAVLVHSAESGTPLQPTDGTRGLTIDRLVLGSGEAGRESLSPLQTAYTVFPLVPREPGAPRIWIGCSHTCDVQINDASISRMHAHLDLQGEAWMLRDNASASGTQVNGEVVEPAEGVILHAGDRVTFGFVDFLYLPAPDFFRLLKGLFRK